SGTYTALQALGWILYALFVLKTILDSLLALNGVASVYFSSDRPPFLWFTLEGFLQVVPLLLIVLSVVMEGRFSVSRRRRQGMVVEALERVKRALDERVDAQEESERAALQMSMRILAASTLSAHGMQYDSSRFCLSVKPKRKCTAIKEVAEEIIDGTQEEDDILPLFSTEAENRHGAATLWW
ncbi:diacylglycerol acyltransferase, partial [Trypanosoma cruzi]